MGPPGIHVGTGPASGSSSSVRPLRKHGLKDDRKRSCAPLSAHSGRTTQNQHQNPQTSSTSAAPVEQVEQAHSHFQCPEQYLVPGGGAPQFVLVPSGGAQSGSPAAWDPRHYANAHPPHYAAALPMGQHHPSQASSSSSRAASLQNGWSTSPEAAPVVFPRPGGYSQAQCAPLQQQMAMPPPAQFYAQTHQHMERTSSSAALATMTDRQRRHHSRSAAKAPPMMTMPISRAPPISSVLQKQEPPANSLHPRKRPPERQAGGPAGEQQAVSGSSKQSEAIAVLSRSRSRKSNKRAREIRTKPSANPKSATSHQRNARRLAISVVPQKRKARRREQGKAKTSTASRYRHALECVNEEPTNVLPGSIVPPYVKIPGRVEFSGTGARYFNLRTKKHFWRLQDPNVLPEVWWWWLSAVSRIKRRRNELKPVPSFLLPDVINHRMRRDEHETRQPSLTMGVLQARKRVPQAAPPPPTSGLGEAVREMAAVWRASASPDCPRIFFRKTFGALWERAWIDAACSVSRHRWDHVRMHFSRGLPPRALVVPASCTTHAHTPADAVTPWQLVLRYPQLVAAYVLTGRITAGLEEVEDAAQATAGPKNPPPPANSSTALALQSREKGQRQECGVAEAALWMLLRLAVPGAASMDAADAAVRLRLRQLAANMASTVHSRKQLQQEKGVELVPTGQRAPVVPPPPAAPPPVGVASEEVRGSVWCLLQRRKRSSASQAPAATSGQRPLRKCNNLHNRQPRFWRKYRSIATGAAGTEGGQLSGLDRPSLWGPVLPWRFRHDVAWLWEHANDRFRVYQRKGRRKILRFKTGRDLFWQRRQRLERRRAEPTRLSGNNSCSGTPPQPQESSAQSESALLSPAELRRLAREIARKREAQPALQSYVHVRDPDNPNAFAADPVWNYVSEAEKQETRRVRASYGRGAVAPSEVHAAVGEIRTESAPGDETTTIPRRGTTSRSTKAHEADLLRKMMAQQKRKQSVPGEVERSLPDRRSVAGALWTVENGGVHQKVLYRKTSPPLHRITEGGRSARGQLQQGPQGLECVWENLVQDPLQTFENSGPGKFALKLY